MQNRSLAVPSKLLIFLCALLGVFLVSDIVLNFALAVLAFVCLAAQKKWSIIRSFGIFYLVLLLLLVLIRFCGLRMVIFSEFYVLMFFRMYPVFLVGWDLIATPPGELSAFLSRLHVPTPVILGLLVVFRFFPTMRTEWRGIWQSMRNRGLIAYQQIARHPAIACEYVLVPLLLCCLQIADQLCVSAVARGAQAPVKRSSYYDKAMQKKDWAWCASWILGTGVVFALGVMK